MEAWIVGIPGTVALALVALVGYFLGKSHTRSISAQQTKARREIKRANTVIMQLEDISREVRRNLSIHQNSVLHFKERISTIHKTEEQTEEAWQKLCEEAERMLTPTMRLSTQIANAYDEIRLQANLLMTFTESRTDPLTGLSNRRALDDSLSNLLAMRSRYKLIFSLAIFDLDHFKKINDVKGHLEGDRILQEFASLLDDCVREADIVTRYGGEEFIVIMPGTDVTGACVFAERLRTSAEKQLNITISGGIAEADSSDDDRSLIARADAALYQAKATGRNQNCYCDGETINLVSGIVHEAKEIKIEEIKEAEVLLAEVKNLEDRVSLDIQSSSNKKPINEPKS